MTCLASSKIQPRIKQISSSKRKRPRLRFQSVSIHLSMVSINLLQVRPSKWVWNKESTVRTVEASSNLSTTRLLSMPNNKIRLSLPTNTEALTMATNRRLLTPQVTPCLAKSLTANKSSIIIITITPSSITSRQCNRIPKTTGMGTSLKCPVEKIWWAEVKVSQPRSTYSSTIRARFSNCQGAINRHQLQSVGKTWCHSSSSL